MKKIVLTSVAALMMGVMSAGAVETCKTCDGSNTKVFFGFSAGMYGINYDSIVDQLFKTGALFGNDPDKVPHITFPKTDTMIGMEAGMRFGGYKSVWNGGFTLAADKTLGKTPDIQASDAVWSGMPTMLNTVLKELKASTNILSATFDNYIRLNKSMENRVDFVVGVGAASIETNVNLMGLGLSFDCHAAVLKAGLEIQLTDVISMTLGSRMYMPVASQYFDTSYALKGGFKFSF